MEYRNQDLLNKIRTIFTCTLTKGWLFLFLMIGQIACGQKVDKNAIHTTESQGYELANDSNRKKSGQLISQKANENTSPVEKNQVRDLGNGFLDHGVAVPYATSRGTVTTVDKQGHKLILIWLYDHRGTYSLLLIDTDSGNSRQFSMPFASDSFTSLLSSNNRYYSHFKGHFVEFDPNERKFTFIGKTSSGDAMSMTEDDNGIIWAALSPNCNLISYNPDTQKLIDYGSLNPQKARQLPRSIAADDNGWIYVTAGSPSQERVVSFNPKTRKSHIIDKNSSSKLSLFRGENGKVFTKKGEEIKTSLYQGNESSSKVEKANAKTYVTGNQALYDRTFPDGTRISDYVSSSTSGFLRNRKVTIKNKEKSLSRTITFDYETEGADIMGLAKSPNGNIVGGSTFPMIFFQYNPDKRKWSRGSMYGQTNTLTIQNDEMFFGTYPYGALLDWNPEKKWIPAHKNEQGTNPQYLAQAYPYISRPHDLLAYPDGQTVILAGRPKGGRNTGGLLFWDAKTGKADVIKHLDGLTNQSTQSLVALPDGKLLGGTTIKVGDSGGKRLAKEAKLYIMDLESKKIEWSNAVIPFSRDFQDLCIAPNGMLMGIASNKIFFVFDPRSRKLLNKVSLPKSFGSAIPYTQGQRAFIKTPDGRIYLLLQNSILKVDPENYKISLLTKTPEKITGGGAYLNDRIYYMGGSRNRIHSYKIREN